MLERLLSSNDKGIAQVVNDLSNPPLYNPGFGTILLSLPFDQSGFRSSPALCHRGSYQPRPRATNRKGLLP